MIILGINAYHAEASAVLIRDGHLVAAAEEERFVRIKHVAGFPTEAIKYCLKAGEIQPKDIDVIAISRNPHAHLLDKVLLTLRKGLFGSGVQNRLRNMGKIKDVKSTFLDALGISESECKAKVEFVEHHRAHLASSFYPSGYDKAVLLSLDGFGDFVSAMWGLGEGNNIKIDGEVKFPHSLGVLYTSMTQFLGFPHWGDEYKVMGLAAHGDPSIYREAIQKLVTSSENDPYLLQLKYFRHHELKTTMTWAEGSPTLDALYDNQITALLGPPRDPKTPIEQKHMDIAAALQEALEDIVLKMVWKLWEKYKIPNLCYAGGVALNCVLNGRIIRETPFKQIFVQPAAHDAGTSLGAAFYAAHQVYKEPRHFVMQHAAWGPDVPGDACEKALKEYKLSSPALSSEDLVKKTADALANGKIIGWFQGRMEYGPRALGHRSLLADPRDPGMKDHINARIKRRESFRPFAPAMLKHKINDYFPDAHADPFMLFTYTASTFAQEKIPSAVHINGTGRLQSVDPNVEPLFGQLLQAFEDRTQVPVLINTSFNEQEPIVCRPEEAVDCYLRNNIDCLALGPYWIERS